MLHVCHSLLRGTTQKASAMWFCFRSTKELNTDQSLHGMTAAKEVQEEETVDPLQHEDFFGVRNLVTLRELFDARVHLGHKAGVRNPYMQPYIFGSRLGVDVLDLDQTLPLLGDALNFTAHIAYREGVIMFLTRQKQTLLLVENTATECGEYSHCRHWKRGCFTNATVQFGAVTRLPDLCIFMSTHDTVFEQHKGIVEVTKLNIPTIGIVDTSADPRLITYPIPGNDDTPSAVSLYCRLFKEATMKGKQRREEQNPHSSDKQQSNT